MSENKGYWKYKMKILGSLLSFMGLCLSVYSSFYYWLWLQLQNEHIPNGTIPRAEKMFIEDYSQTFFISLILFGLLIFFIGIKLYRFKKA